MNKVAKIQLPCLGGTKEEIFEEIELLFKQYEKKGRSNFFIDEHSSEDSDYGTMPFLHMCWEEENEK